MVLVASGKAQEVRLTKDNWLSHPEIVATRDVYKEIRASIDDKTLQHYQRTVAAMGEYVHLESAYVDSGFRVRLLNVSQTDEMGSYDAEIYYDTLNRLRFVYIKLVSYNNYNDHAEEIEYRIYYPIDPEPYRIPMWAVKSINGKRVDIGSEVDIADVVENLDLRNPYAEFHNDH